MVSVLPLPTINIYFFYLQLSTLCLISSLIMCLRSAVRITEEAQSIKRHAVSWHARISMSKSENNKTTHCGSNFKGKSVVGSHSKEFEALGRKVDTTNNLLTERMHFENRKALCKSLLFFFPPDSSYFISCSLLIQQMLFFILFFLNYNSGLFGRVQGGDFLLWFCAG